jgi:predicted nucleotidyltransferase
MEELENLKPEIEKLAKEHNLSLVLLYASQAKGYMRTDSDIDLAVLGVKPISTDDLIALNNEFAQIFKVYEIDVKSLHKTDPLFRYQVMQNSVLLYGRNYDYLTFKSYAFRDYHDSKDLFRLKETLIKKRIRSFNILP